jgi:hypothetical protein
MKLETSFRSHDGKDVCEIQLPDGVVGVFPANEIIAGSVPPTTYAELYFEAFQAYKRGETKPAQSRTDPAQVADLTAENSTPRSKAPAKRKAASAKTKAKAPAKKAKAAKKSAKAKK